MSEQLWRWAGRLVILAAAIVAVVGAQPFAGGWNDGSRLAAVEALGERGTFVIDDSVFVRVPPDGPLPYPANRPDLLTLGTRDKLFIDGHFYSDKSPVPSVLMAGLYRVWLALGGPRAAERPDWFAWFLTVATSGVAYVFAVWCVGRLVARLGFSDRLRFLFVLAFAAATVAPAYSRHVNSHVVLLAVAAALCLALARRNRPVLVGTLAGFGYTLDLGLGPALLVALLPYCVVVYRWRSLLVLLAATPWLVAHHALNYAVGGTLMPANAVAEHLRWPGSPFDAHTMTGGWKHTPGAFALYAGDLLFGKKGFFFHNLPLLLAPAAVALAWRDRRAERPAVAFAVGWALLGGFAYAATSTNLSGQCCSVRWFVPLLAPGFWVVGLLLRDHPRYRRDFAWLAGCGAALGALMWWAGPWAAKMPVGYWVIVAVALAGWGVIRYRDWFYQRRMFSDASPKRRLPGLTIRSSSAA
jgi:hypothetical protein